MHCRDAAACPGGFVTDSSVHHVAALRALAHASGQSHMPCSVMSGYVALLISFYTANGVINVVECLPHLPWIHQATACNTNLATLLPNIVHAGRLVQHTMCTKFAGLYSQLLSAIPLPVDSMLFSNRLAQKHQVLMHLMYWNGCSMYTD